MDTSEKARRSKRKKGSNIAVELCEYAIILIIAANRTSMNDGMSKDVVKESKERTSGEKEPIYKSSFIFHLKIRLFVQSWGRECRCIWNEIS